MPGFSFPSLPCKDSKEEAWEKPGVRGWDREREQPGSPEWFVAAIGRLSSGTAAGGSGNSAAAADGSGNSGAAAGGSGNIGEAAEGIGGGAAAAGGGGCMGTAQRLQRVAAVRRLRRAAAAQRLQRAAVVRRLRRAAAAVAQWPRLPVVPSAREELEDERAAWW
jgi:hypothetical protein